MRSRIALLFLSLHLVGLASLATILRPAGVSPGGKDAVTRAASNCPSFSWTAAGKGAAELAVFRLAATATDDLHEALHVTLPAGALSWTPSAAQCLTPGRYAWSVRVAGGEWSEARLFEVGAAPPATELERLVERVVASTLEKERQRVQAVHAAQVPLPAAGEPPRPLFAASHFTPPACVGGSELFGDVASSSLFCRWIEQAANDEIMSACDTGLFCPQDAVTRRELALVVEKGVQERWGLSGNAGTTVGTHFLGTTDDTAFDIRVKGARALRIAPQTDTSILDLGSIPNLIGGWNGNVAEPGPSPTSPVVGGVIDGGGRFGDENSVRDDFGVVGGGSANSAGTADGNPANATWATVAGGYSNAASAVYSAVSGGSGNEAAGVGSSVGGGTGNTASNSYAAIGGGLSNTASGYASAVPGGNLDAASGNYSFAAGFRAKANADGIFAWADSQDFDFNVATADRFAVRATGGVRFVVAIDGSGAATASCSLTDGTGWNCSSDRNLKDVLGEVDGEEILEQLEELPIYRWRMKQASEETPHLGPMAQDFSAAFGVGEDDTHISTIDLDGVALAAIRGLARRLEDHDDEMRRESAAKDAVIGELERRIVELETRTPAR